MTNEEYMQETYLINANEIAKDFLKFAEEVIFIEPNEFVAEGSGNGKRHTFFLDTLEQFHIIADELTKNGFVYTHNHSTWEAGVDVKLVKKPVSPKPNS